MSKLLQLAEKAAAAQQYMNTLGMMGQPEKPSDRVRADAQYQIAYDNWMRAKREYNEAMAAASDADFLEAMQSEKQET